MTDIEIACDDCSRTIDVDDEVGDGSPDEGWEVLMGIDDDELVVESAYCPGHTLSGRLDELAADIDALGKGLYANLEQAQENLDVIEEVGE